MGLDRAAWKSRRAPEGVLPSATALRDRQQKLLSCLGLWAISGLPVARPSRPRAIASGPRIRHGTRTTSEGDQMSTAAIPLVDLQAQHREVASDVAEAFARVLE